MSQSEFNAYLAQLTKSLRLRQGRSAEVADELRDHLEARLEELLDEGKTRDEAIRLALDEFGDAPQLAQKFSRLAKSRRRRFVMRCTAASSVVVAGVLLVAVSLMPVVPEGPGAAPLAAQEEAKPEPIASSNPGDESVEQQAIAALDRKLGQAVEVEFTNIPLREAVLKLAEQIEADVIFEDREIEEEALTLDNETSLKLEHTQVTARAALDFMLEPEGLAFANRSGILFITSKVEAEMLLTIKVYNVRDLVEQAALNYAPAMGGKGMGGMGGGGFFSVQDLLAAGMVAGQLAPTEDSQFDKTGDMAMGMGGMAEMGEAQPAGMGAAPIWTLSPEQQAAVGLCSLIRGSTSGPWMNLAGTGGTMLPFDGLLVIRQSEQVHNEIRKLLDGLREANESGPGSSVTVPKGDMPAAEQAGSGAGLRDLTFLGNYELSEESHQFILYMLDDPSMEMKSLTQLELLNEHVEGSQEFYDVSSELVRKAIHRAEPQDQVYGSLKNLLDDAKKKSGNFDIKPAHLLLVLLDREDGPIPAVLAHVGLTPEGLRSRIERQIPKPKEKSPYEKTKPLDLSALKDYDVTPDARAVLSGIEVDESGEISQLEALRAVTLEKLPSRGTFLAFLLLDEPFGKNWKKWQETIRWAEADDAPLGELKTLLDAAKKHAGDQRIDTEHLLLGLLDYKDGPIPAVLANVGLTAEKLRERIAGLHSPPTKGKAPDPIPENWRTIEGAGDDAPPRSDEKEPNDNWVPDTSWLPVNPKLFDKAEQSGVLVKVNKSETDHTFASGTIISAKAGETLILTAWHPFRGQEEDWEIAVAMPSQRNENLDEEFKAELIASNEEADLGLLRIDREIDHPVAVVGTVDDLPEPGDSTIRVANGVQSMNNAEPQRVTRIDAFDGPSNIECFGPPATVGSSGGGLFTEELRLVGVCFAQQKDKDRTVYTGLPAIHDFLEKAGHGNLIHASKEKADDKKADTPLEINPLDEPME